jgi:hypothetical protein
MELTNSDLFFELIFLLCTIRLLDAQIPYCMWLLIVITNTWIYEVMPPIVLLGGVTTTLLNCGSGK